MRGLLFRKIERVTCKTFQNQGKIRDSVWGWGDGIVSKVCVAQA